MGWIRRPTCGKCSSASRNTQSIGSGNCCHGICPLEKQIDLPHKREGRARLAQSSTADSVAMPNPEAFPQADGPQLSIAAIGPVACAAVAADRHNMLGALVRRQDEPLQQLLERLDVAVYLALDEEQFTDEINVSQSRGPVSDRPKRAIFLVLHERKTETTKLEKKFLMLALVLSAAFQGAAHAHGFAGARFFPATIQTDDPFVADEGSLPTVTRNPADPDGSHETDYGVDLAKRITRNFGVTFSEQWRVTRPNGSPSVSGWDSLTTGQQYQLFIDGKHEAMGLIGLQENWAHTGSKSLGQPDFTTLSPTFDFGKGFGNLPQSMRWLRPFAITGNVGFDLPTKSSSGDTPNPDVFNLGVAIEYSLQYLESQVKDVGLRAPFNHVVPIVEITSSMPIDRAHSTTTGTIAPGVIWSGQHYQVGAELLFPYGSGQGHNVGAVVQLHFYLDDIFPHGIGKPLIGS